MEPEQPTAPCRLIALNQLVQRCQASADPELRALAEPARNELDRTEVTLDFLVRTFSGVLGLFAPGVLERLRKDGQHD